MEDLNMIAADCIVISCCCECLVLQIVIFILLKVPYKMIRKTREYAKKRLRCRGKMKRGRKRNSCVCGDVGEGEVTDLREEVEEFLRGIEVHGLCCMEEVEDVLEGLSEKGVFGFGSFWGRGGGGDAETSAYAYCFQSGI